MNQKDKVSFGDMLKPLYKDSPIILSKDFRWINLLSIFGIILMWGMAVYQIVTRPNYWPLWAITDFLIGCFNVFALFFSLSVARDSRVLGEEQWKALKKA